MAVGSIKELLADKVLILTQTVRAVEKQQLKTAHLVGGIQKTRQTRLLIFEHHAGYAEAKQRSMIKSCLAKGLGWLKVVPEWAGWLVGGLVDCDEQLSQDQDCLVDW